MPDNKEYEEIGEGESNSMKSGIFAIAAWTITIMMTATMTAPAVAENPEHLKQLLETNQCRRCDLSFVNLAGQNLRGANLEGANLNGSNLDGANLNEAYLVNAELMDA